MIFRKKWTINVIPNDIRNRMIEKRKIASYQSVTRIKYNQGHLKISKTSTNANSVLMPTFVINHSMC